MLSLKCAVFHDLGQLTSLLNVRKMWGEVLSLFKFAGNFIKNSTPLQVLFKFYN